MTEITIEGLKSLGMQGRRDFMWKSSNRAGVKILFDQSPVKYLAARLKSDNVLYEVKEELHSLEEVSDLLKEGEQAHLEWMKESFKH